MASERGVSEDREVGNELSNVKQELSFFLITIVSEANVDNGKVEARSNARRPPGCVYCFSYGCY